MKTLTDKLKETDNLTETEIKLAEFILAHKSEISEVSIRELSERAYVSKASVSRLCRKLGTNGFRDFQITLAKEIERIKWDADVIDINFPFLAEDGVEDIAVKMADLMCDAVREMSMNCDMKKVMRAVELMTRANRIFYYAEGDSLITLTGFMNRLIKLGIFSVDIGHMRENRAILDTIGTGDVLLQVSYSAAHTIPMEAIADLRRKGARTILITAKDHVKGHDLAIGLPSRETDSQDKEATYYSQTTIEYLLNLIYALMYRESL